MFSVTVIITSRAMFMDDRFLYYYDVVMAAAAATATASKGPIRVSCGGV